jgi:hypothetical protein
MQATRQIASPPSKRAARRTALAAAIAAIGALSFVASVAVAGECPADKRVADGQGQKPGPTSPSDVTDMVRASTDLSKEPAAIKGRQFRLREPSEMHMDEHAM